MEFHRRIHKSIFKGHKLESAVDKKVEYHNDTGIKGHFEGYCQKKILPTLLLV